MITNCVWGSLFLLHNLPATSQLTIHHYHPPTCKANPALKSLIMVLYFTATALKCTSETRRKHKTRCGTNSFTCINSHPGPKKKVPLHLPVVDTGLVYFPSRRCLFYSEEVNSTVRTHSGTKSCVYRFFRGGKHGQLQGPAILESKFQSGNVSAAWIWFPRYLVQKSRRVTFGIVSFMRINNHLFTA